MNAGLGLQPVHFEHDDILLEALQLFLALVHEGQLLAQAQFADNA